MSTLQAAVKALTTAGDNLNHNFSRIASRFDKIEKQLAERPRVEVGGGVPGYMIAKTWYEVVALLRMGKAVMIDRPLVVTTPLQIHSPAPLHFVPGGSLEIATGARARLDCPVLNPANAHVFHRVQVNPAYPFRWSPKWGDSTNLDGTFGGNNVRPAAWFGYHTTQRPNHGTNAMAEKNNRAIEAAAHSSSLKNQGGGELVVELPAGDANIRRPVRLDGLRCTLRGQGENATRLWGHSEEYDFDVSHTLPTEDFRATPMVEIGYEWQPDTGTGIQNPDEGFFSKVENLKLRCPLAPRGRVSGVMWLSGLQEGSGVHNVAVDNHSGVAVGAPRFQRFGLHGRPASFYTQLNQATFENLWITGPNAGFQDVRALDFAGVTWRLIGATIDHGRMSGAVQTKPACILGAREAALVANMHIEFSPKAGVRGVGIHVPGAESIQRLSFDSIGYLAPAPQRNNHHNTLWIDRLKKGSVSARTIQMSSSENLGRAIRWGNKESSGYHYRTASSSVASFNVQMETTGPKVATSDRALAFP